MPKKHYTDEEKAAALAILVAEGGKLRRAARLANVPVTTLHEWALQQSERTVSGEPNTVRNVYPNAESAVGRPKRAPIPEEVMAAAYDVMARRWEAIIEELLDAAPAKIEKASLRDVMLAACSAQDRVQLLRGKPTARTDQTLTIDGGLTVEEFEKLPAEERVRLLRGDFGAAAG